MFRHPFSQYIVWAYKMLRTMLHANIIGIE